MIAFFAWVGIVVCVASGVVGATAMGMWARDSLLERRELRRRRETVRQLQVVRDETRARIEGRRG